MVGFNRPPFVGLDVRTRLLTLTLLLVARPATADEVTFRNDAGDDVTVEAAVAGRGQQVLGLELADGRFLLLPEDRVTRHVERKGPEPETHAEVEERLRDRFVEGRVLTIVQKPYVLGLVLREKEEESPALARKKNALGRLARLFTALGSKFRAFARWTKVPVEAPDYPLVVLVFEADSDFDVYARLVTGEADLPAATIAGFYDLRSNQIVIRASAMEDYTTLLHEGVHQQVYNHRIVRRFAPVPTWFSEGIATAFEGSGELLRNDPRTPNEKYLRAALAARTVDWEEVVRHDRAFQSARLAGEAYGAAWGLHWLLVTRHRPAYAKYVRLMASKESLAVDDADTRQREFEETIGVSVVDLQKEFTEAATLVLKRSRN